MTTGSAPGPQLVDYQEGSSIDSALDRLQEDAGVQALRNQYGADVVLLVIGGNADACGNAIQMANADRAFGVAFVGEGCLTGAYYTFAHEIGHIIGLDHNTEDLVGGESTFPYGRGAHISNLCVHTNMSYDVECKGTRTTAQPV